jgi:hypothetical protein
MKPAIEHFDFLGQPIQVGDHISFTWAGYRGVRVGVVTKLTKQRIRMTFNNSYVHQGVPHYYTGNHIARPGDCLVLSDKIQQQLTMATLQKKI